MSERLTIEFGWMGPTLAEQRVAEFIDADTLDHFQKDADAISRLRVRSVITSSAGDKAYDRLSNRIFAEVAKQVKARANGQPESGQGGDGAGKAAVERGRGR
jgi:hypothetical protein